MTGPFDFLHIKGRTAGSSNELSFDVLDAARSDLDERRRATRSRTPSMPDVSRGSYRGVGSTSTLSAVPEVERRKRARRARAIRGRVVAVVLVFALLAAGGYAGYRFYQDKVDFTGHFASQIDRFIEIDKVLVEVDALMGNPLNSPERAARNDISKKFDDLNGQLESIEAEARDMAESTGANDRAALAEVEDAARARRDMLTAAADAFKLSDMANRQVQDANDAWSKVLAGDVTAREATELANGATTEEVTAQARDKTQEAIEVMTAGRAQLAIVEQSLRGLDFSAELAYVDQRLVSLDSALATSDALLAGDRAAATHANEVYNAADRAAAELAAQLPLSLADQVKGLYADEIAQKTGAYSEARAAAATADSALRASISDLRLR